ncbi:hypothetical protein [Mycobacterium malmoense]|uniref:hypothetical protein n=1 Tax=Mycobacterium malmoense TaxID=1780 RepID=UPI0008F84EC4|nr:hypothetical protein [Mycobacterium malmoense]OIN80193.1 hypothetical protein BMG05_13170 [Mycobacterium malmoense]
MSWEKLSDAAAEAVVWSLIADVAKERKDAARAWLNNRMGADAAAVKAIANGETIGRANWVDGKSVLAVVDTGKFVDYIASHHPGELIVTVNSAFQHALLAKLKVVDGIVIDANGEPVPGVAVRESAPYVSVRKSDEARAVVEQLLSGGRLGIDGIRQPELPQGD